jgi:SAM-dependent methyltransferase
MTQEAFQPISVKPPSSNPALFWVRCHIDLQLGSIVKYLRPGMADLRGRILDVGAGESPWKEWLSTDCQYQGIDVDNAAEYGMLPDRPDVMYYDGRVIPFPDASFDGAICIEVMEHVAKPDELIAEIARVLKTDSVLLLSVPWSARRHHLPHDYHRFTRERIGLLLAEHGFPNVEIHERGNDIGSIASKLVVLEIRLLKPRGFVDALWTIPLAVILAVPVVSMIFAAHVSEAIGRGSKEDPLGYFVHAVRGKR